MFANPEGKTISNKPNNEAAKTTNKTKKTKFGIQCVLKTVVKLAPALVTDTISPTKAYNNVIERPKINAFIIPFERFSDLFIKKLTVIGIIGKTQGVKIPIIPNKNDKKKKPNNEDVSSILLVNLFSVTITGVFASVFSLVFSSTPPLILNKISSPILMQAPSS